jgi:hypothetical protein
MLEKIILHIGVEKTGSTSIQAFLSENHEALDTLGFHVIECANQPNHFRAALYAVEPGHLPYYQSKRNIKDDADRQAFEATFEADLAAEIAALPDRIHTMIISTEHFHSKAKTRVGIEKLRTLLSAYTKSFEIICYLREQSDLLNAHYSQYLKGGFSMDFEHVLKACVPNSGFYNYERLLGLWSEVFTGSKITPRIFAKDRLYEGSLLRDFVHCLDTSIDFSKLVEPEVKNQSLSQEGRDIMLALNRLSGTRAPMGIKTGVENLTRKKLEKIFTGKSRAVTQSMYEQIRDRFHRSNVAVRDAYFPQLPTLFQDRTDLPDHVVASGKKYETYADILIAMMRGKTEDRD